MVQSAENSRRAELRERAAAVRSEPVGTDRLGRSYYWDGVSLLVENRSPFSCFTSTKVPMLTPDSYYWDGVAVLVENSSANEDLDMLCLVPSLLALLVQKSTNSNAVKGGPRQALPGALCVYIYAK